MSKFPEYGKLAWLDFEGMVAGASEVRGSVESNRVWCPFHFFVYLSILAVVLLQSN